MKQLLVTLGTALGIVALGLPAVAGGDDETAESIAWVSALPDDCARLDGYQCDARDENDFLSRAADDAMVPGAMMQAWQATLADFSANSDLSDEARNLKHYKFGFSQDAENYIVLYRALLLPQLESGQVAGILRTSVGQTTKYWVDKKTGSISKRLYLR